MTSHPQHAVLIVDDNGDILQVLKLVLESEGYGVSTAKSGEEAIAAMADGPGSPCVVVLDLMMPGMDGLEFLERKLQIQAARNVPVIVISANSAPPVVHSHPNVRLVLRKPFPFLRLINSIEECCGRA